MPRHRKILAGQVSIEDALDEGGSLSLRESPVGAVKQTGTKAQPGPTSAKGFTLASPSTVFSTGRVAPISGLRKSSLIRATPGER